jgi:hypothetical protein
LFPAIRAQSAAAELPPSNITLALSHYHGDRVANATVRRFHRFVQNGDRDVILAPREEPQPTAAAAGDRS